MNRRLNRVRFEINPQAAERSRRKLCARLLTVTKLIVTGEETRETGCVCRRG